MSILNYYTLIHTMHRCRKGGGGGGGGKSVKDNSKDTIGNLPQSCYAQDSHMPAVQILQFLYQGSLCKTVGIWVLHTNK